MLICVSIALVTKEWEVLVVGSLVGLAMMIAVLVDARRNPRWLDIRARYRGQLVLIYRSRDARAYEAVRFALIRALEANRRPRP